MISLKRGTFDDVETHSMRRGIYGEPHGIILRVFNTIVL
jgi:hypothetical protein